LWFYRGFKRLSYLGIGELALAALALVLVPAPHSWYENLRHSLPLYLAYIAKKFLEIFERCRLRSQLHPDNSAALRRKVALKEFVSIDFSLTAKIRLTSDSIK